MTSICDKYLMLYFAWVNADEVHKDDALLKLQKHHFYCEACQARQKELTEQASQAVHPEIEND